ncbi:MAG: DEAD/DEAH box helicase [Actinobacteria bacterium]|nr:DEAD/DEAH box helicase [Actinomycetota bacterium]
MDPREVLELVARTSASGGAGASAADAELAVDHADAEDQHLVHLTRIPARRARTVPLPDDLPAVLRGRLELAGISALYDHQARSLELARAGRSFVVATGTASGKSLCYQLAVLETLLADDKATALYLGPTKALTRDQLRALRDLKLPQVRAAVVDGDTPREERDAIKRTANWVLTNPDLLHHSMLPDHRHWGDFLHRLRWVVVDESHAARGVFGSHIALVLRRLRRLCERYSADPRFVLTSATIGNPGEHAATLTGLEVEEVVEDGSPRGALDLGLWQPPFTDPDEGIRRSLLRETGDLLASFVGGQVQTLVFTKSRKAAELVALFARERLGDSPLADAVRSYRAGYLPEERRELEQQLRDGRLVGVAATEALELGIDVSGLDAVLLAGYPGTAASFWQRLGRAGRTGGEAVGVLVAADDPLDQYLVHHPEELLGRPPEDAVVDPTNPYLLGPHLWCACQEHPLTAEEAVRWFGEGAPTLLEDGVDRGYLRARGERYYWTSRRRAAAQVDIRSSGGQDVRIVDVDTGALIGDVDASRARSQVHTGAVYLHQGEQYEVVELDLERGLATAARAPNLHHATRARSDTDVRVLEVIETRPWGEVETGLAKVQVTVTVTGYDVIRPGTGEVLDRVPLDLPPTELTTVAVYYTIPEHLLDDEAALPPQRVPGSLHAAEHAAIGLLPLIALCDRWDIGGLSTALHPDTGRPSVFVYDGYAGGAGLAERSYRRLAEHLGATRTAIADCGCRSGCPSCVQSPKCGNGNEPLDKDGAVRVLDLLLRRAPSVEVGS